MTVQCCLINGGCRNEYKRANCLEVLCVQFTLIGPVVTVVFQLLFRINSLNLLLLLDCGITLPGR